jgi:hypothetical protein
MSGFELLSKSTLEFHARGAEERKRNHFPLLSTKSRLAPVHTLGTGNAEGAQL